MRASSPTSRAMFDSCIATPRSQARASRFGAARAHQQRHHRADRTRHARRIVAKLVEAVVAPPGRIPFETFEQRFPNRETEGMRDGSDAVSDSPLLNALLNTASGATWVSLHHGGGVGMGFSQHSGMVICCDGSEEADARLARVLWNDPATGVMRHADAGYEIARDCAREHGLRLPAIL